MMTDPMLLKLKKDAAPYEKTDMKLSMDHWKHRIPSCSSFQSQGTELSFGKSPSRNSVASDGYDHYDALEPAVDQIPIVGCA